MGYSPDILIGKSIKNFLLKSELFKLENVQAQLSNAKFIKGLELRGQSKNGHIRYFEVNINPIYKNNKLFGYQGIARDITERKHAEEEMKKRLMKFKLEEGNTYLAKERTPTLAIEAYKELIKIGYNGIIISRTPEKDFNNFENDDIKFLWLAEKTTTNSILPNLNRIEETIESLPNRNIILIDRLDYLFSKHGFKKILMLVHHLKDLAIINNFIILLSIDPSTLSNQELRLLEKETNEIETIRRTELPQHLIDILKFIYHQNTMGTKPSYTEIGDILSLSKPTVRKRVRSLISGGFINENSRGRSKVLDLNARRKNIFQK
jgi:DNA-binding MarR family transcriptional regulator